MTVRLRRPVLPDRPVMGVLREQPTEPAGDLGHLAAGYAAGRRVWAEQTPDVTREVQLALHCPDVLVPLGRRDQRRVADGDPADRDQRARRQHGTQVHGGVDAYLAAATEPGAVEHGPPVARKESSSTRAPTR